MIFFGGGRKSKNPNGTTLPFWCGVEGALREFSLFENYRYGHLYGVRVAKWDTKRWLECSDCNCSLEIDSSEGFAKAIEMGAQWQVLRQHSPNEKQIWEFIALIAQHVLRDPETAMALRDEIQNFELE